MVDYKSVVLGKVGDTPLTVDDVLFQLKTNLEQTIIDDAVHAIIMRKAAEDLGITVSDDELQEAADAFRLEAGLISAAETTEWMEDKGLTIEEFERKVEYDLLKEKVQDKVATEEKMNKLFAENILEFERATIAQIAVNDAGLAAEIKTQLDEEEEDFASLASKYSVDSDTAGKGGFVGPVNRQMLPDEVDVVVFGAEEACVVGPVEAEGLQYIVKIIEPRKADPADPVTKQTCAKILFDDYMAEKGQELKVSLDFLTL